MAGHVAVIALAMMMRPPKSGAEEPAPIAVSLLTESHNEPPPAPRPPPPPDELVVPVVVAVPLINIDVPREVTPPPITVAVAPAPPSPPVPPAPPVSKGDSNEPVMATRVEFIKPPVIVYPAAAAQARASGTAHIRAVVGTDGHVREVKVERSSGFALLDRAASESVAAALFRPYMHDGVPRAAVVIIPMDYNVKVRGGRRDHGPPRDECGRPDRRGHGRDDGPCRGDGPPPQALSAYGPE